jgi:hypothetical protein
MPHAPANFIVVRKLSRSSGTIPTDLVEARTLAVAVPTLVVTIDMTDCRERGGDGTIDSAEKAGGVQEDDWASLPAPIQIVQPNPVNSYIAADWFCGRADN